MIDESNFTPDWDARLALDNIDGDPADLKELLEIWLTQEAHDRLAAAVLARAHQGFSQPISRPSCL